VKDKFEKKSVSPDDADVTLVLNQALRNILYLSRGNPCATVAAEVHQQSYRKPELVEIAVGGVSLAVFFWVIGYFSLFGNQVVFSYPNFAAFILLLLIVVVLAETLSARS
jgi:hypothetical protein